MRTVIDSALWTDQITEPAFAPAEFKELRYKLPDTGFDPACRPVCMEAIKPQLPAHEPPPKPRKDKRKIVPGLPLHSEAQRVAGLERAGEASARRAALNAAYAEALPGRLARGEPAVFDTAKAHARNSERARKKRELDSAFVGAVSDGST